MSRIHPSERIAKKFGTSLSAVNSIHTKTISVADDQFGVLYRLWVSTDVGSETDLENIISNLTISVAIGSFTFGLDVQPFIEHTASGGTVFRHVDLGPWFFDFGQDGFYSGKKGDNIVFGVDGLGTGIKSRLNYFYSGD